MISRLWYYSNPHEYQLPQVLAQLACQKLDFGTKNFKCGIMHWKGGLTGLAKNLIAYCEDKFIGQRYSGYVVQTCSRACSNSPKAYTETCICRRYNDVPVAYTCVVGNVRKALWHTRCSCVWWASWFIYRTRGRKVSTQTFNFHYHRNGWHNTYALFWLKN